MTIKLKANYFGFISAINKIHTSHVVDRDYVDDKRLTVFEKQILDSWYLLKKNKFEEIIDILENSNSDFPYIQAQKHLILGIAYNNKTVFDQAISHLKKCILIIDQFDDKATLFTAYYNLFIAYYNAKDINGLKETLTHLEDFKLIDKYHRILFYQCHLNYYMYIQDSNGEKRTLEILDQMKSDMSEAVLMSHLLSSFVCYVKIKNFDKCESILKELKSKRNFNSGAYFKYLKTLLLHLKEGASIYAYEKDFKGFPHLFHQIMVIKYLETNDKINAKKHWKQLNEKYPDIYLDNFTYKGNKDLFSLCLELYEKSLNLNEIKFQENLGTHQMILQALKKCPLGIKADDLFQQIYGHPWNDKSELNKLHRLVSRLRAKGINIKSKKSVYHLVPKEQKKVS